MATWSAYPPLEKGWEAPKKRTIKLASLLKTKNLQILEIHPTEIFTLTNHDKFSMKCLSKKKLEILGVKIHHIQKKKHKKIPNRWSMVATLFFHSNWLVPLCQRLRQAERGNDKVVFQSPFWYGLIVGGRNPAPPHDPPHLLSYMSQNVQVLKKSIAFYSSSSHQPSLTPQIYHHLARPWSSQESSRGMSRWNMWEQQLHMWHCRSCTHQRLLYHPDFWQSQSPPKDCKLGMLS